MSAARRRQATWGALVAVVACHKAPPAEPDASPMAPASSAAPSRDAAAPPRCSLVADAGPVSALCDQVEVGPAVAIPGSADMAVGTIGPAGSARVLRFVAGAPVSTTLGEACTGADAPLPFVSHHHLFAAACVRDAHNAPPLSVPPLTVFGLDGTKPERLADIPSSPDTFDLSGGPDGEGAVGAVVAWGDVAGGATPQSPGGGGGIKLVTLSSDLHAVVATRHVPSSVGGMDPRLAPRAAGAAFWLGWLATRPEHGPPAATDLEAPSEERAFGWVELVMLDSSGQPTGPSRRLTSGTGHARSFALWSHADTLDVIVQDEAGSLLRVRVHPDGSSDSAVPLALGAFPRLPPRVVPASPGLAWLSFLDTNGEVRLLPLGGSGDSPPRPTVEPSLAGASLLGFASIGGEGGRLALAAPSTAPCAWSMRWAACTP